MDLKFQRVFNIYFSENLLVKELKIGYCIFIKFELENIKLNNLQSLVLVK